MNWLIWTLIAVAAAIWYVIVMYKRNTRRQAIKLRLSQL